MVKQSNKCVTVHGPQFSFISFKFKF